MASYARLFRIISPMAFRATDTYYALFGPLNFLHIIINCFPIKKTNVSNLIDVVALDIEDFYHIDSESLTSHSRIGAHGVNCALTIHKIQ